MDRDRVTFTRHAVEQMFSRQITVDDVLAVLETGEVISRQPAIGTRYPRRLVLGWRNARPLHVVCADAPDTDDVLVVTTYEPDPALWDADFTRSKE